MKRFIKFFLLALLLLITRFAFAIVVNQIFPNTETNSQNLNTLEELVKIGSSFDVKDEGIFSLINLSVSKYIPLEFINEHTFIISLLISALAISVALFYVDKILELLWLYEDRRYFVLLMLLVFPGSFYYSFASSESLFLMLSALTLYFLFKGRYYLSSFYLGLALLTKGMAATLIIPFFFHYYLAEKYNEKTKFFPKALYYLFVIATPFALLFNSFLGGFNGLQESIKSTFVNESGSFLPLGYILRIFTGSTDLTNYNFLMNVVIFILALTLLITAFIKIFLIFEQKSNEQNTLFLYFALYTLVLSHVSGTYDMFRSLSVCLPMFIIPAIIFYSTTIQSKSFLFTLLLFTSLQMLLFVLFLVGVPL